MSTPRGVVRATDIPLDELFLALELLAKKPLDQVDANSSEYTAVVAAEWLWQYLTAAAAEQEPGTREEVPRSPMQSTWAERNVLPAARGFGEKEVGALLDRLAAARPDLTEPDLVVRSGMSANITKIVGGDRQTLEASLFQVTGKRDRKVRGKKNTRATSGAGGGGVREREQVRTLWMEPRTFAWRAAHVCHDQCLDGNILMHSPPLPAVPGRGEFPPRRPHRREGGARCRATRRRRPRRCLPGAREHAARACSWAVALLGGVKPVGRSRGCGAWIAKGAFYFIGAAHGAVGRAASRD
jgi:hypothetical protein